MMVVEAVTGRTTGRAFIEGVIPFAPTIAGPAANAIGKRFGDLGRGIRRAAQADERRDSQRAK